MKNYNPASPAYVIIIVLFLFVSLQSCKKTEQKSPDIQIIALFSDGMVLQQQEDVAIWGTYAPNQEITVLGSWGSESTTTVNADGNWQLTLATPQAGGPFNVNVIAATDTLFLKDVLIGEVWLASGQSNMEMPLMGWPPTDTIANSAVEIAAANYANIRMFTVTKSFTNVPVDNISGRWQTTTPETAGSFSASAYFFAKRLYQELHVPIGIIHSSWGGTVAEAWTSKAALQSLNDFDEAIALMEDADAGNETKTWFNKFDTLGIPQSDEAWETIDFSDLAAVEPLYNDSEWETIILPGRFDELSSGEFNGAMWFRKKVVIENIGIDYTLTIGSVDDMDVTFVNGRHIGGLTGSGKYNVARVYDVPAALLVEGENTIAIRAIDTGGPGLISGPMQLTGANGEAMSLEGEWKTRLISEVYNNNFYVYDLNTTDFTKHPVVYQANPNTPTVLYNAMIAPLVPYTLKGAIWYQGESNVGRAEQYEQLFPTMIRDWRTRWGEDFSFYFVQIAPFTYNPDPVKQVSQKLREAQRRSLQTKKTGMVVTLDIGNPINIHPANKQDVGSRLAGLALSNDYGIEMVASGPLFKSTELADGKLIVSFDYADGGLVASSSGLSGFEIAGEDKIFITATARIVGNQVVVHHSSIKRPQYVRYAWRDNSVATLFNVENLPASSFSSEDQIDDF